MYYPNQIIWDKDNKRPVRIGDCWDLSTYPKRNTHFLLNLGTFAYLKEQPKGPSDSVTAYNLALPSTLEAAEELLSKGLITPSCCPPTHCWKCGNWWANHTEKYWCKETEAAQRELLNRLLG